MTDLKLNETPVRTSRNFNSNNITLKDIEMPENIEDFTNIEIDIDTSKISQSQDIENGKLKYGLGEVLENQVLEKANKNIKLNINGKSNKESIIKFNFDSRDINLIENLQIVAEEGSTANIFIKYSSVENQACQNSSCENIMCPKVANENENTNVEQSYYHNGIIKVIAKSNSHIKVTVVNLLDEKAQNFLSIDNTLEENAKLDFCIVDFGGKNSITNYYSNLVGESSENNLNSIYLGKENQVFDLNYIGELYGKKSNMNIEVQGALKDESKKHFKGTLDFKRGAKKAKGDENEFCMLLSDKAKSLALPMLLCEEEDVEGNHSTAAGKLGNKELFYIMSRGFSKKEAMKLIVRAKFNKIIEKISNDTLKKEISYEIDRMLD
jgi:Fe-S cluster assembly scaffold protein SufB